MRKKITSAGGSDTIAPSDEWFDLEQAATVDVTSEAEGYPVEAALIPDHAGWRAAGPGPQTVRLRFDEPRRVRRVWLHFAEPLAERTQEFILRWAATGQPARELMRQRWTFSPGGSTEEVEDYRVDLPEVIELELVVTPDISGGEPPAALARLRVA